MQGHRSVLEERLHLGDEQLQSATFRMRRPTYIALGKELSHFQRIRFNLSPLHVSVRHRSASTLYAPAHRRAG
jgi:hypothetical protein